MGESNGRPDQLSDEASAFDLLHDLERQTSDEIRRQRDYDRIEIKAGVVIERGDSSRAGERTVEAITGDISANGCRIMSPVPLGVGDIYRLQFDRAVMGLPLMFARCLRCKLIREDAFEVGFLFFNAVRQCDVMKDTKAHGAEFDSAGNGGGSLI